MVGAPMVFARPADTGRTGRPRRRLANAWDAIDALIHQPGKRGVTPPPASPSCTRIRQLSKSADQMRARAAPGAPGDHRATLTARRASECASRRAPDHHIFMGASGPGERSGPDLRRRSGREAQ